MISKRAYKDFKCKFSNAQSYQTKKYYTTTREEKSLQILVKNNFVSAGER